MRFFLSLVFVIFTVGGHAAENPAVLYLTWTGDPATSMTIQWHTSQKRKDSVIFYQKEGLEGWSQQEGGVVKPGRFEVLIHTVQLQGLEADTVYQFKIGPNSRVYKFRTMPNTLNRPVKFAVAGDAYFYLYLLRRMNQQIAKTDPDFVIVGGDIAYTEGNKSPFKGPSWEIKRWGTFLKEWTKAMVASDGRLIPMLVVVGNHDVQSRKKKKPSYLLFHDLFARWADKSSYGVYDFGDYLSLFLLDTGHIAPIAGMQRQWLERSLKKRSKMPYKFAAYHFAAYPAVYAYNGVGPQKIRSEWVPLFEQYGIDVAFEHHNHAYKRTHPLKGGKVDENGVVYFGDGSWGVAPRVPKNHLWYMAKAEKTNCFCLVTLDKNRCQIEALDNRGKSIDQTFTMTQRGASD